MQLDFKKKNSDMKFCGQGIVWWWLRQLIKNPNFFLMENPNFVILVQIESDIWEEIQSSVVLTNEIT
jgi:hypothetical protein